MSDEGKDDEGKIQPDEEGKIPQDGAGKYPEVVSWTQFVGIKESLGKKLDAEKQKVTSLEERLSKTPNAEEHDRVKGELDTTKTKLTEITTELDNLKSKSASEKRETLKARGIPEDKLKDMSEKELDAVAVALRSVKPPGPDMGGGGGASAPTGSPMELARQAYGGSNK